MTNEHAIKLLAKMYEYRAFMRDKNKSYAKDIETCTQIILGYAEKHGIDIMDAGLALIEVSVEEEPGGWAAAMFTSALVEYYDTDELVRGTLPPPG